MFDDPMDEGDLAADYQARHNQDAIARTRRDVAGTARSYGAGAENCEWCGAEIPAARRAACPGCTLCVECQTIKERLKSGL
jgi:phage/conjugal plasmid C-4 type zinc finger TraR family protein